MTPKMRSGKAYIPHNRIGRNAKLEVATYVDDYLRRLNRLYPVGETLGEHQEGVARGNPEALTRFTRGAIPVEYTYPEGERILSSILVRSAHAEKWQPDITDVLLVERVRGLAAGTPREYHRAAANGRYEKVGLFDKESLLGTKGLVDNGVVKMAKSLDQKVIIIPTQAFVEYCASRR